MGAICQDCGQDMLVVKFCTFKWVKIDGQWYRRLPEGFASPGQRCHDCGAIAGPHTVHHQGCDNERCPKCGGQFIGCTCNVTHVSSKPTKPKVDE